MKFFTLDIKDYENQTTNYYTVKYENQIDNTFVISLIDDTNTLVEEKIILSNDELAFHKLKNFIATFGKIQRIHPKFIDDTNRRYAEILLEKTNELKLVTENKYYDLYIKYWNDRLSSDTIYDIGSNGLITIYLSKLVYLNLEQSTEAIIMHSEQIISEIKKIAANNKTLYDDFDITYEINLDSIKNSDVDSSATLTINRK